ncbi:MAG TPA: hypothetical protein VMU95_32215, partial [Trebonia sp.]|nr:hypothetical protein [Trebonia sp.]
MAVMHVPGRQPTNWSDVPPESPIKDLLDLRNRLDTGHRRAEIIEGRRYATVSTARVGEKLRIPAPFDLTLDTSTLPEVA